MSHKNCWVALSRAVRGAILSGALSMGSLAQADEQIIGMGTHFGQGRTEVGQFFPWVHATPFTSFRDEIYWGDVERQKGVYNPPKRSANTLLAIDSAAIIGMRPLLVLDYGNYLYDGGTQPYSTEAQDAFARYAAWATQRTKCKVDLFEIWNEWNIGGGKKPRERHGDAATYVQLVQKAAKAIKDANPSARVIGGAMGDDYPDWQWLREAIDKGLLAHVDGISIHLYNHSYPLHKGGAAEFIRRLTRAHEILVAAAPHRDIPLYITEVGWPNDDSAWGISYETAATQAVVFLLEARALNYLKGIWFYEFQNRGRDKNEREDNFGFVDSEGNNKPVACASISLAKLLRQSTVLRNETIQGSRIMLFKLQNEDLLLASWTPKTSPKESTYKLKFKGDFAESSAVDTGCHRLNTDVQRTAEGITVNQGYLPTLIQLKKGSKVRF